MIKIKSFCEDSAARAGAISVALVCVQQPMLVSTSIASSEFGRQNQLQCDCQLHMRLVTVSWKERSLCLSIVWTYYHLSKELCCLCPIFFFSIQLSLADSVRMGFAGFEWSSLAGNGRWNDGRGRGGGRERERMHEISDQVALELAPDVPYLFVLRPFGVGASLRVHDVHVHGLGMQVTEQETDEFILWRVLHFAIRGRVHRRSQPTLVVLCPILGRKLHNLDASKSCEQQVGLFHVLLYFLGSQIEQVW